MRRLSRVFIAHAFSVLYIFAVALLFSHHLYRIDQLRREHADYTDQEWQGIPNNGDITTSFGVHITPYYIFSEDFHLYFTRTRRILRFGFVDDIMEPSTSTAADFRNSVQVLATIAPALLGRNLKAYSLIYLVYLSVAMIIVYSATVHLIRDRMTSLIITMVAFLSAADRALRLSTNTLTIPLLLLGTYGLIRAVQSYKTQKRVGYVVVIGVSTVLFSLSLWDVWSFFVLFVLAGIVTVYLWLLNSFGALRGHDNPDLRHLVMGNARTVFPLALSLGAVAVMYWLVSGSSSPDSMMRAGFKTTEIASLEWIAPNMSLLWIIVGAAGLLCVRRWRETLFIVYVGAVLSYLAVVLCMVFIFQIEPYQLSHFSLLYKVLLLWLFLVGITLPDDATLRRRFAIFRREYGLGKHFQFLTKAVCLLLAVVWMNELSSDLLRDRYPQFAIPREYEDLLDFIERDISEQEGRTFLTLSHEANYLLAYHSDFDLLLPEGFPLHSKRENQEVIERMAETSVFLGVTAEEWERFLQPDHARDQKSWMESRVKSAQEGYLYYLFHRYSLRTDQEGDYRALLAKLKNQRRAEMEKETGEAKPLPMYEIKLQAWKLKDQLLSQIRNGSSELKRVPDYILVEEVFSALGASVPVGYEPIRQSGTMRLYKRKV